MKAKFRKVTAWLLAAAMLLALMPGASLTAFAAAGDSESEPIIISTAQELADFAAAVNGGNTYEGKYIKLTDDIDLSSLCGADVGGSEVSWTPIGVEDIPFKGTFDGGEYTVSGLYINEENAADAIGYGGLFGYIGEGGTVKNLTVSGSVFCYDTAGGVVATNAGTVENCTNTVSVACSISGGVVGANAGTVTDCSNAGSVTGYVSAGGVVGMNAGTVTDCTNTGSVTVGDSRMKYGSSGGGFGGGGIVGAIMAYGSAATVENCSNSGDITCAADGTVVIISGGVCGAISGSDGTATTVKGCYNTGDVSASGNDDGTLVTGGIVAASADATVENCYNTGDVTASGSSAAYAGGIAGANGSFAETGTAKIQYCYSTGTVSGDSTYIGGVLGVNDASVMGGGEETYPGEVSGCFYLEGTAPGGIGGEAQDTDGQAAGKTAADLADADTYVGWDFDDTWEIDETLGRPVLTASTEEPEEVFYNIYIGGVQITSKNAADVFGDGTVSYDAETKTLTLNGCDVKGVNINMSRAGLYTYEENTIIELIGENNTLSGYDGDSGITCGIEAIGNLTIQGSGSLDVSGGSGSGYGSAGIRVDGGEYELIIKGGCTVYATGMDAPTYVMGISNASGKVTIDSSTVTAAAGYASGGASFGIEATSIELKEATVTASGVEDSTSGGLAITSEPTLTYENGYQWKSLEDGTPSTDEVDWDDVGGYFHIEPIGFDTPEAPDTPDDTPSNTGGGGGGLQAGGDKSNTGADDLTPDKPESPDESAGTDNIRPDDTEPKMPFADVAASDWFYDDVKYAYDNGLMNGTSPSLFSPNGAVTRAMMVTVLYRAEGSPSVDHSALENTFEDVEADSWYETAVAWAQANGIVKGYSETEFRPDGPILREQIAAIMHRYAQYKGYDVTAGESTNILSYADYDSISEYAIPSIQYAVGSGLMRGKTETTINPQDSATRAEIAAILRRFIEANK